MFNKKIKKFLKFLYTTIKKKNIKIITFYTTLQKIKIFKFLKIFKDKNINYSNTLIKKFRNLFLRYKIFSLLFKNLQINYRERRIIVNIKHLYKKRKRNLLIKCFNDLKLFFICEKFRKMKKLQKAAKIFYFLKFLTNK